MSRKQKRDTTPGGWKTIHVTSGFGHNSRQPFIQMEFDQDQFRLLSQGKVALQLEPNEARDLAMNLTQAAEASEQDAFIVHFVMTKVADPQLPEEEKLSMAYGLLTQFREFRIEHGMGK